MGLLYAAVVAATAVVGCGVPDRDWGWWAAHTGGQVWVVHCWCSVVGLL